MMLYVGSQKGMETTMFTNKPKNLQREEERREEE
jgi:hypothetical protein